MKASGDRNASRFREATSGVRTRPSKTLLKNVGLLHVALQAALQVALQVASQVALRVALHDALRVALHVALRAWLHFARIGARNGPPATRAIDASGICANMFGSPSDTRTRAKALARCI